MLFGVYELHEVFALQLLQIRPSLSPYLLRLVWDGPYNPILILHRHHGGIFECFSLRAVALEPLPEEHLKKSSLCV